MTNGTLFILLVIVPVTAGLISLTLRPRRLILLTAFSGVGLTVIMGLYAAAMVFVHGPMFAFADWLFLDALSAYHLMIMVVIFGLSSAYALSYFGTESNEGRFSRDQARTLGALWPCSLGAMILVLISNNLGIMWVGMESTTLLTAFLICVPMSRSSLEAMWKYILICSVGIAFAFVGTLLMRLAARDLPLDPNQSLLWTRLLDGAALLDPAFVKAAFIFVLVGYGTKAGLAPMHSWLPDAHSRAPAPVSAMFSGFMLNTALYCIVRYLPIIEQCTGKTGWAGSLLAVFGGLSIFLAASFILFQRDLKRLFAYSSVEHLGIIALGFGLGGMGTFAALFHTLNHALSKSLAFFAAGRLGQVFETHEMSRMSGSLRVSRLWGAALLGAVLSLVGAAPFSIFISELQVVNAALEGGKLWVAVLFLVGTSTVFLGALSHILPLVWGIPVAKHNTVRISGLERTIVCAPLGAMLLLGLWLPAPLTTAINEAVSIVQQQSPTSIVQSTSRTAK